MTNQQGLLNLLGAMYVGALFLGGTSSLAVLSVVAVERTAFYRERAARMYSELPCAFSQAVVDLIYVAIQTFGYGLILYSMIGFHWHVDKFFWFHYNVLMCFSYHALFGMMLVALTPSYQIAAISMAFFLGFWNLFSGFIIPRTANAFKPYLNSDSIKSQYGGDGITGILLWYGLSTGS